MIPHCIPQMPQGYSRCTCVKLMPAGYYDPSLRITNAARLFLLYSCNTDASWILWFLIAYHKCRAALLAVLVKNWCQLDITIPQCVPQMPRGYSCYTHVKLMPAGYYDPSFLTTNAARLFLLHLCKTDASWILWSLIAYHKCRKAILAVLV